MRAPASLQPPCALVVNVWRYRNDLVGFDRRGSSFRLISNFLGIVKSKRGWYTVGKARNMTDTTGVIARGACVRGAQGSDSANYSAKPKAASAARGGLGGGIGARMRWLFDDLSGSQLVAGALAAVTSMLFASKIGIAGSVIGAAIGYIVSTVASQVYKKILLASADKLSDLKPGSDDAANRSGKADIVVDDRADSIGDGTVALSAAGSSGTAASRAGGGLCAPRRSTTPNVADPRFEDDLTVRYARALRARKRKTRRNVIAVSVISALVAVVFVAILVSVATSGEGVGPKTAPMFSSSQVVQGDSSASADGSESGAAGQPSSGSSDADGSGAGSGSEANSGSASGSGQSPSDGASGSGSGSGQDAPSSGSSGSSGSAGSSGSSSEGSSNAGSAGSSGSGSSSSDSSHSGQTSK